MSETLETHDYVPSMRGSYKCMFTIVALFVVALLLSFVKSVETEHKYLLGVWILWIVISAALLLYMKIKTIGVHLYVKPHEVEYFKGIFDDKSIEIKYRDFRMIEVNRTFVQKLLNIGDLLIASSGTGGKEIIARNMPNPRAIRDEIQARQDNPYNVAPAAPAAENAAAPAAAPEQAE